MPHINLQSNKFSFSVHNIKTFKGYEYANGWQEVVESDWRKIALAATRNAWSPIVWRDGVRDRDNFLYSDICGLDFDDSLSLTQGIKNFCDMHHFIGLTRNHQKEKHGIICDRFRLVAPWERRITTLDEYEYNMERLQNQHQSDRQALDGARIFFPCTKIVAGATEGHRFDVKEIDPNWMSHSKRKELDIWTMKLRADSKTLSAEVIHLLREGTEPGQRNKAIYKIAKELSAIGCSPSEIYEDIMKSPITKRGEPMSEREIDSTILSANKYVRKNLGGDAR